MPNINKVVYGNTTLIDLTDSTLSSADQLLQGVTAYDRSGTKITGTATGGGTAAITIDDTTDSHGGTVRTITALDISDTTATASDVINSKWFYTANGTKTQGTGSGGITPTGTKSISISTNGTTTEDVTNYASAEITVNVSGTSKNTQVVQSTTRTNSSAMTALSAELTVSKTGTYDIYYSATRTNTSSSYTWATQLYKDGTAQGSENTTWSNNVQNVHLTNQSLTANQKLRVYGRHTRGSSYYVCAPMLAIVES